MTLKQILASRRFKQLISKTIQLFPYGDANQLLVCSGIQSNEEILKAISEGEEAFYQLATSPHCTGIFASAKQKGKLFHRCSECEYLHARTPVTKITLKKKATCKV